ncbi:MAG TPA: hypothetical protein VN851_08510, partial [Thermoanaerobaculia bacterium]|nr:hypothetical protein [Thermoanaerobaculia bacterium]
TLGRQALRPARITDLADPRLPRRLRLALAGFALATTAPLGGLVLPALAFLPPSWRIGLARKLFHARAERLEDPGKILGEPAGTARERAERIARRRRSTRTDLRGGGPWRHFDLEFSGGISGLILLAGGLLGETQLWPRGFSPVSFEPRLADVLGALSLALLPLQALLMDRYLDAKTPFPGALPSRQLAARRLLATIPGLGLVLIPAWRRVVELRPSAPPLLDLTANPRLPAHGIGRAAARAMQYGLPGVVTALSLLPLGGLLIWLAVRAPFGIALVAFAILHLVAAFLLRRELVQKAATEPARSAVRWERDLFPLLTLLPLPLGMLPLVARIFLTSERRTETLTWAVYARRQSARNEPMEVALAERRAAPPAEGLAATGSLTFVRWKCFLVAFDVLVLAGVGSRWGARSDVFHWRGWSGLSLLTLGPINLTAFGLGAAALGLAILGAARLARLFGRGAGLERRGIPDAARTLFLTQAAAALGQILAPFAAADRMREFLLLAAFGLVFAAIGGVLLLMPGSASFRGPGGLRHMRWLFLYLGLMAALLLLGRPLTRPGAGPALLIALALVLPVLHLALYRARAAWFLRAWQGSLRDRALPFPLRLVGGFLQATAALPLGGLLLPAALLLRAALESRLQSSLRTPSDGSS